MLELTERSPQGQLSKWLAADEDDLVAAGILAHDRQQARQAGAVGADRPATEFIDELPIIAVLATQADGDTEIRDAGELRSKEVDRIAVLETGLRALGASCESTADSLVIATLLT